MIVIADSRSSGGNLLFNIRTWSSTIKDMSAGRNLVTIWLSNLGSRNSYKKKDTKVIAIPIMKIRSMFDDETCLIPDDNGQKLQETHHK